MIYLINTYTKQIVERFKTYISWDKTHIIYPAGKGKGVKFAKEYEYFTDTLPENKEEN